MQGTIVRKGQKRDVRFGSLEFASEVLPPDQVATAAADVATLASDSVVSVLVDSPTDRQGSSRGGEDVIVRYARGSS